MRIGSALRRFRLFEIMRQQITVHDRISMLGSATECCAARFALDRQGNIIA